MLVHSPLPSFLDTYSLSMSPLGCKALSIVISFLVLWSICWSSLIHFKSILQGGLVFTPLMRFLLQNFVSRSFLVHSRYSFLIYSFIFVFLWRPLSISPYFLRVFHTSWSFFTGAWVTASYFYPHLFFPLIVFIIILLLACADTLDLPRVSANRDGWRLIDIVVGNGYGDTSSNPGRDWLHFT